MTEPDPEVIRQIVQGGRHQIQNAWDECWWECIRCQRPTHRVELIAGECLYCVERAGAQAVVRTEWSTQ